MGVNLQDNRTASPDFYTSEALLCIMCLQGMSKHDVYWEGKHSRGNYFDVGIVESRKTTHSQKGQTVLLG